MEQDSKLIPFPPLSPCERNREFDCYSDFERASVVYNWLFTTNGYREMDKICLNIDGQASRGWQSMGIAHFLGLRKQHKSFFFGWTLERALCYLLPQTVNNPKLMLVYCYLRDYGKTHNQFIDPVTVEPSYAYKTDSLQGYCWTDEVLLHNVNMDSIINEKLLLMETNTNSEKHELKIKQNIYRYSEATLKETLKYLYDFTCTICGTRIYHIGWSEILARKLQWHYLSADVHHILPLSKGGPDIYQNMICLCPNCHRKFHTGEYELKEVGKHIICKDQVLGKSSEVQTKHTIHLL